jgi:hypothetical protein
MELRRLLRAIASASDSCWRNKTYNGITINDHGLLAGVRVDAGRFTGFTIGRFDLARSTPRRFASPLSALCLPFVSLC